MPPRAILKITEIFPSIQGEGLRQGEPTIFVRLSGCNLKCSFCDTKYAWKEGRSYTVDEVLGNVIKISRNYPARWVCFTGGEPLLQNIRELARRLSAKNFKTQVETNGTFYKPLPVDWFTVSPKPPKYFYQSKYRKKAKEVKIIVTKGLKSEVIQKIRREFPREVPILLQPQSNRLWSIKLSMKLLKQALAADLENIRVTVQLHKIYGLK
jgi:7-carboxy-7-deazaguanine synthase